VNGRTRILDTGAIASDALKQISADYASMKGLVNGESDPASAQPPADCQWCESMRAEQERLRGELARASKPPGARHDFREEAIETISDAITDQLGHDDDVLAGVILEALVEENMIVGGPYFAAPPPDAPLSTTRLLGEIDEYLSRGPAEAIHAGSILHQQIKSELRRYSTATKGASEPCDRSGG
jgi:hypothetical protein